jgi:mevalonate kinase
LEQLGVSHPSLDLIIKTAAEFGLKAKITGAGGGGNCFVLLPPGLNANKLSELQAALNKNGFINFEVTLFGPGILY